MERRCGCPNDTGAVRFVRLTTPKEIKDIAFQKLFCSSWRWVVKPDWLIWAAVGFGVLSRLRQYLFNRSLWFDEALLALNLLDRSAYRLVTEPLALNQGAPPGFLLLEKLVIFAFGSGEYALRLVALLAGMVALVLFAVLSRRLLGAGWAAVLAVTLLAVLEPLIYYASELKQYSADVMWAVLILLTVTWARSRRERGGALLVLAGLGAVAVWCSHPAVFVLGGAAVVLSWESLRRRELREIGTVAGMMAAWAASFILLYRVSLRALAANQILTGFWNSSFMPLPPQSLDELKWFPDTLFGLFRNPGGLYLLGLGGALFLVGCWSLLRSNSRRLTLLAGPMALALIASALHLYPFGGRLLLFLVPALVLLMVEGMRVLWRHTRSSSWVIPGLLVAVLLLYPMSSSLRHLAQPHTREEIKPVLEYVQQHRKAGDVIYLYRWSVPAFTYYADRYGLDLDECIKGTAATHDWRVCVKDLPRLRGLPRVWVIFSHALTCKWADRGADDEEVVTFWLDNAGMRLDSFSAPGSSAYLYDLSPAPENGTAAGSPFQLERGS